MTCLESLRSSSYGPVQVLSCCFLYSSLHTLRFHRWTYNSRKSNSHTTLNTCILAHCAHALNLCIMSVCINRWLSVCKTWRGPKHIEWLYMCGVVCVCVVCVCVCVCVCNADIGGLHVWCTACSYIWALRKVWMDSRSSGPHFNCNCRHSVCPCPQRGSHFIKFFL